MTITPQDLVTREVHYCVSSLVSMLAAGYDNCANKDLNALCEQAVELANPVPDWEDAAIQAGIKFNYLPTGQVLVLNPPKDTDMYVTQYDDERNASIAFCDFHGIDPYDREVFEHWIVSDWMADKLEAEGEKIDRDFAGLTVWARTTTGQAIYADSVIEHICATLNS